MNTRSWCCAFARVATVLSAIVASALPVQAPRVALAASRCPALNFSQLPDTPVAGFSYIFAMALGDFAVNSSGGDSRTDVAIAYTAGYPSGALAVLHGNGDGHSSPARGSTCLASLQTL